MSGTGEGTEDTYPRPQLVRSDWVDLCGEWGFTFDDDDRGLSEGWVHDQQPFERTIAVPYPPESKLSGVEDPRPHAVVWYRRALPLPTPEHGRRWLLHFGAVDYAADVWVDGAHVGRHEGGHTPFSFDITDALGEGQEHVLVVRAEDHADDVTQPRGKQDWMEEPHGLWYHRTTGIWQPVWAEEVPAAHVVDVQWTPDVAAANVTLTSRLSRLPEGACQLRVRLYLRGQLLAEQSSRLLGTDNVVVVPVPGVRNGQDQARFLWSPATPNLIDACVDIVGDDGSALDTVTSYFGMRTVGAADGRFLLNGQPFFLRLALAQGYWPESHLAAPGAEALRREAELVKSLGFNGVRVHQKVEDPRFLAWCDRLGLVVWDEMPSAFEYAPRTVERVVREWVEVVNRDRSHPSVVAWVPLNESWGVWHIAEVEEQQHFATALYHLTKALDGTRPVISNDGWEHTESDIWGVHDYAVTGDVLRSRYEGKEGVSRALTDRRPGRKRVLLGDPTYRGQPVVLSEFGGLSYSPRSGEKWFGYATVDSPEDLTSRLRDLVDAVLDNEELAGFCYTQLVDTEQETNGLLTEGRDPKIPAEVIRAIVSRPARGVQTETIAASRRAASEVAHPGTSAP